MTPQIATAEHTPIMIYKVILVFFEELDDSPTEFDELIAATSGIFQLVMFHFRLKAVDRVLLSAWYMLKYETLCCYICMKEHLRGTSIEGEGCGGCSPCSSRRLPTCTGVALLHQTSMPSRSRAEPAVSARRTRLVIPPCFYQASQLNC